MLLFNDNYTKLLKTFEDNVINSLDLNNKEKSVNVFRFPVLSFPKVLNGLKV